MNGPVGSWGAGGIRLVEYGSEKFGQGGGEGGGGVIDSR